MPRRLLSLLGLLAIFAGSLAAQQAQTQQTQTPKPPSQAEQDKQAAQDRASAEKDVSKVVEVLDLKPGMTVADVGAGGGSMSVVLAKWIGAGHVFATDIGARQLELIRNAVKKEGLTNVTVVEGAAASTNLPAECCDAVFLRLVYHHITAPGEFDKSLLASLKPGGRLAIIEFLPDKGSKIPDGVPANREGHGIPVKIVESEFVAAGFTHVKTIEGWPDEKSPRTFVVLFKKN